MKAQARKSGQTQTENRQGQSEKADCPCEWAKMCNRHLSVGNKIDHRSYERQGKLKVPTIHEGADARKIEEKYLDGQIRKGSWKGRGKPDD